MIAAVVALNAAAAIEVGRAVRGADLRSNFADHELSDGVQFAYRFHADGTFSGFNMGKAIRGTWRADDDMFCWTWLRPVIAEECLTVERNSKNFRFVLDGHEVFGGTLGPIEPKNTSRGVSQ